MCKVEHDPEEISIDENSTASKSEQEILVNLSESGSEQDWDMEDSDANNESLSTYNQSYTKASEKEEGEVSPPTRRKVNLHPKQKSEINYDSEEDVRTCTLYKRDPGEETGWELPDQGTIS